MLMNAAGMAPHPVARVALAVAAVECLAAGEKWNSEQKKYIKGLRAQLGTNDELSVEDKEELLQAIDGLNNFGVQGRIRRLFVSLDLREMIQGWEMAYKKRSGLFHGSKIATKSEQDELSGDAWKMAHIILKNYIKRQVYLKIN